LNISRKCICSGDRARAGAEDDIQVQGVEAGHLEGVSDGLRVEGTLLALVDAQHSVGTTLAVLVADGRQSASVLHPLGVLGPHLLETGQPPVRGDVSIRGRLQEALAALEAGPSVESLGDLAGGSGRLPHQYVVLIHQLPDLGVVQEGGDLGGISIELEVGRHVGGDPVVLPQLLHPRYE
jgi:hypothetical protein